MNLVLHVPLLPGRTAEVWLKRQAFPAVCHPHLPMGVYAFQDAYLLDDHAHSARLQFGERIIEMSGPQFRDETLYVFAQTHPFGVSPNVLGLPAPLFDQAWNAATTRDIQLEVVPTWWLWGKQPIEGPMIAEPAVLHAFRARPPDEHRATGPAPTWTVPPIQGGQGDALFAQKYPAVPRVYRPHALLAWYAWLLHRNDALDRSQEGPAVGFEGATTQRVTTRQEATCLSLAVDLFDGQHSPVGKFSARLEGADLTILTSSGHTFYIKDTAEAPVLYFSDGETAFSWDGRNQLVMGAPKQVMAFVPGNWQIIDEKPHFYNNVKYELHQIPH